MDRDVRQGRMLEGWDVQCDESADGRFVATMVPECLSNDGKAEPAVVVTELKGRLMCKEGTSVRQQFVMSLRDVLPRLTRCRKLSVIPWEGYSTDGLLQGLCQTGTC